MAGTKKVLVFKINGEEFAANIMQVERILGYVEPTNIPESPEFVRGVIKYQEGIIPVIDLKKRLSILENSSKTDPKIIVVKHTNKSIGLIVDMVTEVIDINDEEIEEAPDIVKGISNKYITGMIKSKDMIIVLINTEKILTQEQMNEIDSLS